MLIEPYQLMAQLAMARPEHGRLQRGIQYSRYLGPGRWRPWPSSPKASLVDVDSFEFSLAFSDRWDKRDQTFVPAK